MGPLPGIWLAARMADLMPDLQVCLSWGSIAESFHSLQSLSVSCFYVILGLSGPNFLSTCNSKTVLTAPFIPLQTLEVWLSMAKSHWHRALRSTHKSYTRGHVSWKKGSGKRELVAAPWTSSKRFSHVTTYTLNIQMLYHTYLKI